MSKRKYIRVDFEGKAGADSLRRNNACNRLFSDLSLHLWVDWFKRCWSPDVVSLDGFVAVELSGCNDNRALGLYWFVDWSRALGFGLDWLVDWSSVGRPSLLERKEDCVDSGWCDRRLLYQDWLDRARVNCEASGR